MQSEDEIGLQQGEKLTSAKRGNKKNLTNKFILSNRF